nr:hypothetical protein [Tanacetum cinerariifolium]GEW79793.1 hypothetical protein [Tanacetum cinerariifolium]
MRFNHQNFSNSKRNFALTIVLTKFGIVSISTVRQSSSRAATPVSAARPINTVAPKPLVNVAKPRQNALQKSHSLSRRPFYQQTSLKNRNLNNKINTAKVNSVNTAKGNRVTSAVEKQGINAVKSSACWVWRPKIKFWNIASSETINSVKQIHAIVDGMAIVISESSVRSDLLFDDEDGITCLTNDEIFENLALMGYEQLSTKLTFQKGGSPRRQKTIGGTPAQTRSERVLEQPNVPPLSEGHTSGSGKGRMEHTFELIDTVQPTPYDSPLTRGYIPGSDEGRLKLLELMNICTALSNRVTTVGNELSSTKDVYHKAFITLTKRVKKLETQLKQK